MNKVTKTAIEARIVKDEYFVIPGTTVTICSLTLENGFSVRGESACVDPANFNADEGKRYARENAVGKIWQLEGYLLAEQLSRQAQAGPLLSFGDAIALLKEGCKVARIGWNGKGMWLSLSCNGTRTVKAESFWSPHNAEFARENGGEAKVLPSITMKTATGELLMGWLASQTDMLADDWVIVE